MRQFLLLLFTLSFLSVEFYGQINNVNFEHISLAQGLSHNTVNCILQDRKGFMWFGTRDGLNKYDGYSITVYENNPWKEGTLSSNSINTLYEDTNHTLWIGTADGLNKYEELTNRFTTYRHDPTNPNSLSDNTIYSFIEDQHGLFWIGTSRGLNRFDQRTGEFTLYQHSLDNSSTNWSYNTIHAICEDKAGDLWVGTGKGISLFNRNTGTFTRYPSQIDSSSLQVNTARRVIYEDRTGSLWIGTALEGLQKFDKHSASFSIYKHDPKNPYSLSDNNILSIYEDHTGTLWIGTNYGGLNKFDRSTNRFSVYYEPRQNPGQLANNSIMSLHEDRSGILWIGTFSAGVNKLDRKTGKFQWYQYDASKSQGLRDNYIYSLYEDKAGVLWIGNRLGLDKLDRKTGVFTHLVYESTKGNTFGNKSAYAIGESYSGDLWIGISGAGLKKLSPQSGRFTTHTYSANNPYSLADKFINDLYEDKQGILWIASRVGLHKLDPATHTYTLYLPNPTRLEVNNINYINCLYEDKSGTLWVGTAMNGLNKFDKHSGLFTKYLYAPHTIKNQNVSSLYQDHTGNIWIGLAIGGLYKFDPQTGSYFTQPGLPHMVIQSILEDAKGNLWLSTRKSGIYKYNPTTKLVHRYTMLDGLLTNSFNHGSFKNKQGEMFFSSDIGFAVFHPDSIQDNPYIPQLALTGFRILDKPVTFNPSHIKLTYRQNVFAFDFVALSYTLPKKNQYAYKLENFQKDWVYSGTRRYASYTNLDPGEYVFRVKASNNDGIWNQEGISIPITIFPPPWRTWWAYTLYTLFTVAIAYSFYHYLLSRERLKHDLKLKQVEAAKLQEMDQVKSRFFTNISHEFRTPLTLILGPLEKIRSKAIDEQGKEQYYDILQRNATRLLELINQLLDLSKLEAGNMRLHAQEEDLVKYLKAMVYSFASLADAKQIHLECRSSVETLLVFFDKDKLEKVMFNLLSNAFKFTPSGGSILVEASLTDLSASQSQWQQLYQQTTMGYAKITVEDSGIGIAREQVEKIFDRFYQVDSSPTRLQEGTGIGLALAKELVELHQGKITVESEVEKGTSFTVYLPLGKDHLREVQVTENPPKQEEKIIYSGVELPIEKGNRDTASKIPASVTNEHPPMLLIVEDNADVRLYVKDIFVEYYTVIEARDGEEGLQSAIEHIPDMIISDLMMPRMDGLALCQELKIDQRTSHIPVILLTAKAATESKIEGLETGADDYVTKPFYPFELKVRVKNLIEQRKRLRERFSRELKLQPKDIAITSVDEQFLQRAIGVVEKHLSEPEFSAEDFSSEMNMSRVQLHRKLKALTDQSATEFVRQLRLKRAAQLLEQHAGNIAQLAYEVGFNNMSYFAKCFKELYNLSPSEYAAKHEKIDQ